MLFLHKNGMISAPVPGATAAAKVKNIQSASVTYESVNLLNYDGKPCDNNNQYNYDECKQEYIYKVINVCSRKQYQIILNTQISKLLRHFNRQLQELKPDHKKPFFRKVCKILLAQHPLGLSWTEYALREMKV